MAVLVFVLFWVLVAFGLVYLGLRSDRKPADSADARRGGRAYWYVAFGLILVGFGVGVPVAASLGQGSNAESVPSADIRDLTEGEEHGRELFGTYCKQCHMLEAANAVAQVGPSLDTLRPTKELVLDAIEQGRARGNGAMAADLVTGEDAQDVADFVALAVGQTEDQE